MKLFLLFAVCATAGSCCGKTDGFEIRGRIPGKDTGAIYLYYTNAAGESVKEEAVIENGRFVFTGDIKEPTYASLLSNPEIRLVDDPGLAAMWLEPGRMTLELPADNFKEFTLKGSRTNDEEAELDRLKAPVMEEMQPVLARYHAETDHEKAADIREEFEPFHNRMDEIEYGFFMAHPDSYISAHIMRFKVSQMSADKAQELFNTLSDRVKNSKQGQEIAEEIEKLRMGSPGSEAFMFKSTDIHGKPFDLATLKGEKYILLDFWASWCVPCRKGNPHLKELYAKYKDSGLEVVLIASDDSTPDAWREAVGKDQIGMFHHVLSGLKTGPDHTFDKSEDIGEKYGIHTLPTKILIGKDGVIAGRYGGGGEPHDQLDVKLAEIFGF